MPRHQKAKKDVISCGEAQIAIDPQISEWGNPPEVNAQVLLHEFIV